MTGSIRSVRIGTRLTVGFGVVVILASIAVFLGFNVSRHQQDAADRVSRQDNLALQIQELNYHNATMNSLQNFYMWDFSVSGPAKALAPDAFARTMFTDEKPKMYALLDRIDTGAYAVTGAAGTTTRGDVPGAAVLVDLVRTDAGWRMSDLRPG